MRANDSASVIGGLVLGMAPTTVNPPARAAHVPLSQSSLCVAPMCYNFSMRFARGEGG
jgi:hypothetical protein